MQRSRATPSLFLVAFLGFFSPTTAPCQQSPAPKISVQLQFDISPDDLKNEITSYLKRELRSLRDVTEVDAQPDYRIKLLGMTATTKAGDTTGFILSVLVLSRLPDLSEYLHYEDLPQNVAAWLQDPPNTQTYQNAQDYLQALQNLKTYHQDLSKTYYSIHQHYLRVGPLDAIKVVFQELVTEIDSDVFEAHRSDLREIEAIKKKREAINKEIEASRKAHKKKSEAINKEIEAIKKKNEALDKEIEALKKKQ